MAFGLLFYVVYRKGFEGTTLTRRVSVTEQALTKQVPELAYRSILVPIFGTKLDDDIVSTAGRLAAAGQEEKDGAGGDAKLDLVYVIEVPLSLPLDADLPPGLEEEARRALERASDVGDEYADVEVSAQVVRARKVGAGIVDAARRAGAEAIVVGAEPPSRIRAGRPSAGSGPPSPRRSARPPSTCSPRRPAGFCSRRLRKPLPSQRRPTLTRLRAVVIPCSS